MPNVSEYGMKLNPNKEHAEVVLKKLEANQGYCPCLPVKNKDTLCPCKYLRKFQACRCGLYVRGDVE
ncbi:MAG: hypothetical protein KHX13_04840 [Acidaminococcus intestini]|uniref:Ferredoxin-thioredoxin reductase subunit B n=1 Tax=Acidaminococcus intestini TaxID=187327 RepID=A0A943EGX7_9FIRM|nr:hypothetical protein [Acidaminococcus intestini]